MSRENRIVYAAFLGLSLLLVWIAYLLRSEPTWFLLLLFVWTMAGAATPAIGWAWTRYNLQNILYDLIEQWEENTRFVSNPSQLIGDPAMQQIIQLGRPAIPLILQELKERPNLLALALPGITGESPPVPKEHYGKLEEIVQAWIRWGEERGYC